MTHAPHPLPTVRDSAGYAQSLWAARVGGGLGGWLLWLFTTEVLLLPGWIAGPGVAAFVLGVAALALAGNFLSARTRGFFAARRREGALARGLLAYTGAFGRDLVTRFGRG